MEHIEEMRTWLDERPYELYLFTYMCTQDTLVFVVHFKVAIEAAEFTEAFDGKVLV